MSDERQQAREGFPVTREAAVEFAKTVKRRAAIRAADTVEKVKRFGKRDAATCVTPVGTMRVRELLRETGVKVKDNGKIKVRG